ncbi:MAG: PQQ-binding-like beta-propeller repeat protein [Proteobacteria bacterium]|nr:PQQ-binding-like beta-propeller repeat protein [Pseudomonadota bacterium]
MASGWRVTTGLRGPAPIFIGEVDGAVWIGNRGDDHTTLASFDVHAGTPGAVHALPTPLDGRDRIDGGRIAQQVGDRVSVFDVAAGRQLFEAAFRGAKLVLAHGGQLLLTRSHQDPPEMLVVDARTGSVVHTIKLGLGIALRSEVFAAGRRAVVFATEAVLGVDLEKGRVVAKRAIPAHVRIEGPFGSQLFVASDAELACFDIEQGKAVWTAPLGREVVGDSLCAVRVDRERVHVIGAVERPDGAAMLITAFDRASGVRGDLVERAGVRRLPLEAMLSPPAAPFAITEGRQVELHVPGRHPVRIPLPPGSFEQQLWTADHLFLLGSELLAIRRTSLTDAPAQPLALTAITTPADAPAEVTFVGTSSFMKLTHPLYGDIRVSRDASSPVLKVGDQVLIEGVQQLPGKVVKIDGWRPAGTTAAPSELVLGVDALPASRPSWPPVAGAEDLLFTAGERDEPAANRAPLGPVVAAIEAAFGGAVPLLHTLAAACDASPRTRERWERIAPALGIVAYEPEVEVPGLDELGFTAFASDDGRVLHGVVRSPDGNQRGVAVLDVEGDHDLGWTARTFEEWLVRQLIEHSDESRVRLMLEDLGLPASVLDTM